MSNALMMNLKQPGNATNNARRYKCISPLPNAYNQNVASSTLSLAEAFAVSLKSRCHFYGLILENAPICSTHENDSPIPPLSLLFFELFDIFHKTFLVHHTRKLPIFQHAHIPQP